MRNALIVSIAAHVILLIASHFLGHRFQMITAAEFIDVSLVAAPAAAVQPAPAPAPPAATPEPPAEKVFPDVAERPDQKREREKRVTEKERQAQKKPKEKEPAKETAKPAKSEERESPTRSDTSGTGTAATGTALGGVRVDNVDFQFAYYLSALRNKLASHWSPGSLTPGSPSRLASVYFRISRDGSIHEVSIEESSGNSFFDQSVIRAVYAASPVAPLPYSFSGSSLGVHVDFNQTP